jgi:hypothetical protein
MGYQWSFEIGGFAGAPGMGSVYLQPLSGSEWDLTLLAANDTSGTDWLDGRYKKLWGGALSSGFQSIGNGQVNGDVTGEMQIAGPGAAWNIIVNLHTSSSAGPLKPNPGPQPDDDPPLTNGPAYLWIPVTVPSNAIAMSFDFILQSDWQSDLFAAALNGTNILSLGTSLVETNVALNSGMIDVEPYGGQQVEVFLGIVGETSTNASLKGGGDR